MLGWLAGRYMTKETRRVLAIVSDLPAAARRQVMAHVSDKMGLVNNAQAKGGSEFYLAMRHVAAEAQRERQNAVSYGARSFSDPRWCAPALVEQWAMAWLAMKQGRISRARFDKIDASLWEAINEALAPAEIVKAGHQSAPKLFLSYRREDSAGDARGIYGALAQHFGADNVFFDVNSIVAGERFVSELRHALSLCAVFIPVIGSHWLRLMKERLHGSDPDYVRMEVEAALKLDVAIIPVLLSRDGRIPALPKPHELPGPMGDLFAHQTHVVSHERFERDVADLFAAIRTQVTERLSRQWMTTGQRERLTSDEARIKAGVQGETEATKITAVELAMRLNQALKHFIALDTDVFKPSPWRAIGLSRIPFGAHRSSLAEIQRELAFLETSAQNRNERTFTVAAIYAERLRTAVRMLEGICAGLELKANGEGGPRWAEYSAMVDAYSEAKNSYSALGPDLNRFYRDATLLDERDRRGGRE